MSKVVDNTIDFNINQSTIRAGLKKLIRSDHSELIVDVIIGHLSQHKPGLEQLFMAMAGLENKLHFKPLDEVFYPIGRAPSWKIDTDKTIEAGMVTKGYLKASVTDTNEYRTGRVQIEYYFINSTGDKIKYEEWVNEAVLSSADEPFPEDLDLPF